MLEGCCLRIVFACEISRILKLFFLLLWNKASVSLTPVLTGYFVLGQCIWLSNISLLACISWTGLIQHGLERILRAVKADWLYYISFEN